MDEQGNLYIADTGYACVRKVMTNGIIVTIAGTLRPGYSGDGGPAAAAQLNGPVAVAVDAKGNLYVADSENNAIRMLKPIPSARTGFQE